MTLPYETQYAADWSILDDQHRAYDALKEYDDYAKFLESTGRIVLVTAKLMELFAYKHRTTVDEMKNQWRNLKTKEELRRGEKMPIVWGQLAKRELRKRYLEPMEPADNFWNGL